MAGGEVLKRDWLLEALDVSHLEHVLEGGRALRWDTVVRETDAFGACNILINSGLISTEVVVVAKLPRGCETPNQVIVSQRARWSKDARCDGNETLSILLPVVLILSQSVKDLPTALGVTQESQLGLLSEFKDFLSEGR